MEREKKVSLSGCYTPDAGRNTDYMISGMGKVKCEVRLTIPQLYIVK